MEMIFEPKDVFFNNDIVNLCQFLEESSIYVQIKLTKAGLTFRELFYKGS